MPHMQEQVTQHAGLACYLHDLVSEHPDFEVLCEPTADVYCFRYLPNGLPADRHDVIDRLNGEIVQSVQRQGSALVNQTEVGNRVAIRISICSCRTLKEDIDATFEAIARCGRLLTKIELTESEHV